jgi:hypothetical protein
MLQIYNMGPTALLPLRRKACCGFLFALKNPTASAVFEPANLGTKTTEAARVDMFFKYLLITLVSHTDHLPQVVTAGQL